MAQGHSSTSPGHDCEGIKSMEEGETGDTDMITVRIIILMVIFLFFSSFDTTSPAVFT